MKRHITRFNYGRTLGWWVRIRRQPNPCSKLFSDGKYGGEEAALAAAMAWRDEMLEARPSLGRHHRESSRKKFKTGVPGLYLEGVSEEATRSPRICVSIIDHDGQHRNTQYSVTKWGVRKALWKACVVLAQGREPNTFEAQTLAQDFFAQSYKHVSAHLEPEQ